MIRLGCDIGGTFTDFLLHDAATGAMETLKLPTTPDDPSRAILQGLEALAAARPGLADSLASLIHGTTLVINAVIERKGAPTALLATAGFPDILEMRREIRYDIYDLRQEFPAPIVPRRWRLEAPERILADGTVETPLDETAVAEAARRAAADGVESLAICFLHSYANPEHERRARAVAQAAAPQLDISLSSEVLPEIREFERTATTVVNAYVRPVVNRYLGRLTERLAAFGFARAPALMLSGGGVVGVEAARRAPVRLAESGPVGGAIAAVELARQAGARSLLAFDMGGTTAKLCLIEEGRLPVTADYEVDRVHRFKRGSGTPVAVPTVDLIEIGAGGGSIAAIDGLGLLRIGPESAGAEPGPVCYGRGGTRPTVTDADLALGWLDPEAFRPAERPLDAQAARAALARDVGAPLGLATDDAAAAVIAVVEEAMAGAARMHAVERGGDARAATMVAYGGAGPLHADGVARRLGCRTILVPPAAGVFSALGFLASPVRYEASRTRLTTLDGDPAAAEALEAVLRELEAEAGAVAAEAAGDAPVGCERIADMAYAGQGHSLRVALAPGPFDPEDAARRFAEAYAAAYGYAYDDMTAQVVTLRVVSTADAPAAAVSAPPEPGAPAPRGTRPAWDPAAGAMVPHAVAAFETLRAGETVAGPALIEARGTTARVGAGAVATMTPGGWLRIDIEEATP
jgi:N-methylhydantoinase A